MTDLPATTVEHVMTGRSLFLASPCILRSDASGAEATFDRSADDAPDVLRGIFAAHLGRSPLVEDYVAWCMDSELPRYTDSKVNQRRDNKYCDWGPMFDAA